MPVSKDFLTATVPLQYINKEIPGLKIELGVFILQVADPRLARLSVKDSDGIAKPKVISRRQARDDSDDESGESAEESSEESDEEDETVTARRQAVKER